MTNVTKQCGLATAAITALLTLGLAGEASAALISCPAAFTTDGTANVTTGTVARVSAASLCEYLDPPNNSTVANATNVNAAGFFGVNTWSATAVNQVNANSTTGSWSLAGANFSAFQYMITFKDGSGTNLVSFLLNGASSSGSWFSPFTNPPFTQLNGNQTKAVSHFSIFQSAITQQVPEPSTLALLGVGFAIAMVRRRQKNA